MTKLMHYTSSPLTFDPNRTYRQCEPTTFGKPHGLWVSVTGKDDWPNWVRDNMNPDRVSVAHSVTLSTNANVLRLSADYELQRLSDDFAVETDYDRRWSWRRDCLKWPIDWRAVAEKYDGIVIAPYQWSMRMALDWYYGWDCASGCVWNLAAVESVTAVGIAEVTT